jgi:hypothetical protein
MGKVTVCLEFEDAVSAFEALRNMTNAKLVEVSPELPKVPVMDATISPAAVVPEEAPKKRGRKPKEISADSPALDAAAATVEPVKAEPAKVEPAPAAEGPHAQVRVALTQYALAHGKEKAKALLPASCAAVSALTEEQCAEVMKKINGAEVDDIILS